MKARIVVTYVAIIILASLISRRGYESETKGETPRKMEEDNLVFSEPPPDPVLSDTMLTGYAGENTSAAEDLEMIAHFIDSVFLLVKERNTADYSTNEDLVLFLQGSNSHRLPFLAKVGPALNSKGQLVDRWNSPLITHPVSQKVLELRSAGPDKTPYTGDDLLWPVR